MVAEKGSKKELSLLREELQTYIDNVEQLDIENEELRDQLMKERVKTKETFLLAKQSWRQQALEFAEKERRRAELQSSLSAEFICMKCEVARLKAQEKVLEALISASPHPVLLDCDVADCCFRVSNPSTQSSTLDGMSVWFRDANLKYPFQDNIELAPKASVTVWWGKNNSHLAHPSGNSLHWGAMAADRIAVGERAELYRGANLLGSTISYASTAGGAISSDSTDVDVDAEVGTKRKRTHREAFSRPELTGRQGGPLLVRGVYCSHKGSPDTGAALLLYNEGQEPCRARNWVLEVEGPRDDVHTVPVPDFVVEPSGQVALMCGSMELGSSSEGAKIVPMPDLEPILGQLASLTTLHLLNAGGRRVTTFSQPVHERSGRSKVTPQVGVGCVVM